MVHVAQGHVYTRKYGIINPWDQPRKALAAVTIFGMPIICRSKSTSLSLGQMLMLYRCGHWTMIPIYTVQKTNPNHCPNSQFSVPCCSNRRYNYACRKYPRVLFKFQRKWWQFPACIVCMKMFPTTRYDMLYRITSLVPHSFKNWYRDKQWRFSGGLILTVSNSVVRTRPLARATKGHAIQSTNVLSETR